MFVRLAGKNDATSSGGNEGRHESQSGDNKNSNAVVLTSDVIWTPGGADSDVIDGLNKCLKIESLSGWG